MGGDLFEVELRGRIQLHYSPSIHACTVLSRRSRTVLVTVGRLPHSLCFLSVQYTFRTGGFIGGICTLVWV